jgi:ribosomal-protein-alanine N-acetyltransferase
VDALHALWISPEVRRFLWDDVVITRGTAEQVVEAHFTTLARYSIGYWALHIPPLHPPAGLPIAGFCGIRLIDDGPDIELIYGLRGEH